MTNKLVENHQIVQALWSAVNSSSGSLSTVGPLIRRVLDTGAWKHRMVPQLGREVKFKYFYDFINKPPLEGCGWESEQVEALIKDDIDLLEKWTRAVTGVQGAHHDIGMMKAKQGNTRSYTVSRLKRDHPKLFERVCNGEMSPNAAAIAAGFRKKLTPFEQIKRLVPKLTDDERRQLIAYMFASLGGDIPEPLK